MQMQHLTEWPKEYSQGQWFAMGVEAGELRDLRVHEDHSGPVGALLPPQLVWSSWE